VNPRRDARHQNAAEWTQIFSQEDRKVGSCELGRHADPTLASPRHELNKDMTERRKRRICSAPKIFARPSDLPIFL
jgi:hypothetical protein